MNLFEHIESRQHHLSQLSSQQHEEFQHEQTRVRQLVELDECEEMMVPASSASSLPHHLPPPPVPLYHTTTVKLPTMPEKTLPSLPAALASSAATPTAPTSPTGLFVGQADVLYRRPVEEYEQQLRGLLSASESALLSALWEADGGSRSEAMRRTGHLLLGYLRAYAAAKTPTHRQHLDVLALFWNSLLRSTPASTSQTGVGTQPQQQQEPPKELSSGAAAMTAADREASSFDEYLTGKAQLSLLAELHAMLSSFAILRYCAKQR
jgi:hypothetical protein